MLSHSNQFVCGFDLGDYFICTPLKTGIEQVKIMQKGSKHRKINTFVYFPVGNRMLYEQTMDLSAIKFIVIGDNLEYVSFNCNGFYAEILDLFCLDTHNLKGSHLGISFAILEITNEVREKGDVNDYCVVYSKLQLDI